MTKASISKAPIFLADLTHVNYTIAANVMPLGIGLLASALLEARRDVDVRLFKYPDDLAQHLEASKPALVGFSNYSWNLELSYAFAKHIKEIRPECVVVFGGPNYGLTELEIEDFWLRYPAIDFYVVLEAEVAFSSLVNRLIVESWDVAKVKARPELLSNCHYLRSSEVIQTPLADRIQDLDSVPSPYLKGLMDKFFDNQLIPLTHSTRGCPFTCTFCSEGSKYYQKVAQRTSLHEELEYIAQRRGIIPDLALSDANFGMFVQDKAKAETIRHTKSKYGWPQKLVVSTGKNQKARILEVAEILEGSLSVAASLQSTDSEVLNNIQRSNISLDALRAVVNGASESDSSTYTELILNLPGDSLERHEKSLRDVTDMGLGIVRMYQLILLPQTELNTPESRKRHGIETRFRINPRSFGQYELFGKTFVAAESEEIAVASNSMTFEDYLDCRELDLTVEIIHNTGFFAEIASLFRHLGLSWFDLIKGVYSMRRLDQGSMLSQIYEEYRQDNLCGLYESREAVSRAVAENIETYLADLEGTNEIAKAKALAVANCMEAIHALVFSLAKAKLLDSSISERNDYSEYLDDLERYSIAKKRDFLNTEIRTPLRVHYDFVSLEDVSFEGDPLNYKLQVPDEVLLIHSETQIEVIHGYTNQYDTGTIDGLGRILMRANPRRLFRRASRPTGREGVEREATESGMIEKSMINAYGGFTVD